MSKRTLAVLALLGATFFWGIGPVIMKTGLEEVPTFSLAFLRTFLSLIIILPFVLITGKLKVKKLDLTKLFIVGLFGSGINTAFFLSGVFRTSATAATAIFATVPLVNAVAASIILKEKPTMIRIIGVVVGFFGSLIIAVGPAVLGQGKVAGDVFGNILVLGAVFSWVAYIIYSKQLLKVYSPITIVSYSLIAGCLMMFPLFVFDLINNPNWYTNIGTNGLFAILYGGILNGIVAFLLFQWAMKYVSAFEAGIIVYLQPVLTAIFAIPVLGEKLSPVFLIGTSLILGGVFLSTTYELIQKRREET